MQHLAAQPEIQEAERQLTPYLEKERDMSSPRAPAFFINAMMQQAHAPRRRPPETLSAPHPGTVHTTPTGAPCRRVNGRGRTATS